jgi:hypothetical protein
MMGNGFVLAQHCWKKAASRDITIIREKLIQ